MKFKEGDHVEVINPDNIYYREDGKITYRFQLLGPNPNKITYQVSFEDACSVFEEDELRLLEEVTNNQDKDSKISRVEQTHNSINKFLENSAIHIQSKERSLSIIAQMLVEINETLAIICDKL